MDPVWHWEFTCCDYFAAGVIHWNEHVVAAVQLERWIVSGVWNCSNLLLGVFLFIGVRPWRSSRRSGALQFKRSVYSLSVLRANSVLAAQVPSGWQDYITDSARESSWVSEAVRGEGLVSISFLLSFEVGFELIWFFGNFKSCWRNSIGNPL